MPIYKQLPRTKPKVTDEFKTILEHAFHWVNVNWKIVLSSIGAVAVVASLILIIVQISRSKDEKASELLFTAEKASTDKEAAYEKVFKEYPGSKPAAIARLRLSDLLYSKGEYEKAIEVSKPLENFKVPETRILALHQIAAVKLKLNDTQASADYYLKAYKDPLNRIKWYSYFNAGLSLEEGGKIDEAKKIFEEINNTPDVNPSLKKRSKDQLVWLSIKK